MPTILFVNASGEISGAERSLLAMLDALDRDHWSAMVASPVGPLLTALQVRDVPHYPCACQPVRRPHTLAQGMTLLADLRRSRRQLLALIAETHPNIIHANTTSAMLGIPFSVALPIVWHVRDLTPLGPFGAQLYRHATRVAVISSAVRDAMQRYARHGGDKIVLLPPAVDTTTFHPLDDGDIAARSALCLTAAAPIIGLIAQFVPWKRHQLFLDALSLLVDLPWHAVLAGADFHAEPSYLRELRERISCPPLLGRVSWLPWQEDASTLISALDICALTSQREPFGRVLIEAMSCAVPVVAVDEGGARDIIKSEENGLLTFADPILFAAALRRLLENAALRHRLGNAGRERVVADFSLVEQRRQLDALYKNIDILF